MNEVEAVKAAIANTTDSDGDRMDAWYTDSELHAVALAAIAALDAARGDRVAQLAQLTNDEVEAAYRRGRYDGRVQGHISEGRWWCFGVLCGVVLSVLVWSFWP